MTIFVNLNHDEQHRFFLVFHDDREKRVADSASNLLKKKKPKEKMFPYSQPIIIQKQQSRGVFKRSCAENMQQIYRRKFMPKCDFNKVAFQFLFLQ